MKNIKYFLHIIDPLSPKLIQLQKVGIVFANLKWNPKKGENELNLEFRIYYFKILGAINYTITYNSLYEDTLVKVTNNSEFTLIDLNPLEKYEVVIHSVGVNGVSDIGSQVLSFTTGTLGYLRRLEL